MLQRHRLDPRLPGLSPQLKFAWNEVGVMERLFPPLPDMAEYQDTLRGITAKSNEMLFTVVEDMADTVLNGKPQRWTTEILRAECMRFLEEFHRERDAFVLRNQPLLLQVLRADAAKEDPLGGGAGLTTDAGLDTALADLGLAQGRPHGSARARPASLRPGLPAGDGAVLLLGRHRDDRPASRAFAACRS